MMKEDGMVTYATYTVCGMVVDAVWDSSIQRLVNYMAQNREDMCKISLLRIVETKEHIHGFMSILCADCFFCHVSLYFSGENLF